MELLSLALTHETPGEGSSFCWDPEPSLWPQRDKVLQGAKSYIHCSRWVGIYDGHPPGTLENALLCFRVWSEGCWAGRRDRMFSTVPSAVLAMLSPYLAGLQRCGDWELELGVCNDRLRVWECVWRDLLVAALRFLTASSRLREPGKAPCRKAGPL